MANDPPPVPEDTFSGLPTTQDTPRQTSAPVANVGEAVALYLEAWIAELGEGSREAIEALTIDYARFRKTSAIELPYVSQKTLSRQLVRLGCIRIPEDRRRKGSDGRRVTLIEMRKARAVLQ